MRALANEVVSIGDIPTVIDGGPAENDAPLAVDYLYRRQVGQPLEKLLELRPELLYIDRSRGGRVQQEFLGGPQGSHDVFQGAGGLFGCQFREAAQDLLAGHDGFGPQVQQECGQNGGRQ